jgi:hypothetical protein
MFRLIIPLLFALILAYAQESCITCHTDQAKQCENSKHATLHNAINITREAWGIHDSNVTLQTIPKPKTKITQPADLVDDFLRRKCLKCHLGVKNSGEEGMRRGRGCLACHTKHYKQEQCQRKPIATTKCLTCHNKTYVGTDYLGLFPKDHHHSFRAPLTKEGNFPSQKYGIDHHTLTHDIHHEKGMRCVDCHNNKNGKNWESGATCTECHPNPSTDNHPSYHSTIACSTCHSSWNMNSYELSVLRDDTADYQKWKELTLQEDGYLSNFLAKALKSKKKLKPQMPDWVEMKQREGIWYSGWRFRRWEHFVLGNDASGAVKILRPLFQYRISYRDKNGTMVLDDVGTIDGKKIEAWLPYAPHTITKRAKSCEQCHENPLQTEPRTDNAILNLMRPQQIIHGTPLRDEQLNKLHSPRYKKVRAKMLIE